MSRFRRLQTKKDRWNVVKNTAIVLLILFVVAIFGFIGYDVVWDGQSRSSSAHVLDVWDEYELEEGATTWYVEFSYQEGTTVQSYWREPDWQVGDEATVYYNIGPRTGLIHVYEVRP